MTSRVKSTPWRKHPSCLAWDTGMSTRGRPALHVPDTVGRGPDQVVRRGSSRPWLAPPLKTHAEVAPCWMKGATTDILTARPLTPNGDEQWRPVGTKANLCLT